MSQEFRSDVEGPELGRDVIEVWNPEESAQSQDECFIAVRHWTSVRHTVKGVMQISTAKKSNLLEVRDDGIPINPGSLYSYISAEKVQDCSQASPRPSPSPLSSRASPSPLLRAYQGSPRLAASPRPGRVSAASANSYDNAVRSPGCPIARPRVRWLGKPLTDRHTASRTPGISARSTLTPMPPLPIVRAEHPKPFVTPHNQTHRQQKDSRWVDVAASEPSELLHPTMSPRPPPWIRTPVTIRKDEEAMCPASDAPRSFFTHDILSYTGSATRPEEKHHPILTSIEKMEHEDVTGALEDPDGPGHQEADGHQRGISHLSRRLECRRWNEARCVKVLIDEPGPLAEFSWHEGEAHVDAGPRGHHMVAGNSKQKKQNDRHSSYVHMVHDFKRIPWLIDPVNGSNLPPEAFVPMMFWLGFSRQRHASLELFEMAFGAGNLAPEKIAELAPYVDVQILIAEAFQRLARKESFEQICEYVTDRERLTGWWSSMLKDSYGRVELGEMQKMFARMEIAGSKVLFRFLSHYAAVHHGQELAAAKELTAVEILQQKAGGDNKFTFPFFSSLLSRCVVTWCIVKVLDLVDPQTTPRGTVAGARAEAKPQGDQTSDSSNIQGEPNSKDSANGHVDPNISRRWAQVHRRIVTSLLVNHRYWGWEGKCVLAQLSQPSLTVFDDLTPEHWVALYQRVRAQGMASTFPEGDEEYDDPSFLSKRCRCAVDQ